MPTKAQLEERLEKQVLEAMSAAAHVQRKHDARIEDLQGCIEDLEAQVMRLRGALRPHFFPAGQLGCYGTAVCPVCDAKAHATLKYNVVPRTHVVAQGRPIVHREDCIFAEQDEDVEEENADA